jgi:hypothetical protein
MKVKSTRLTRLFQKVRDTWNAKASQYAEIPAGGCALVFPNYETYQKMIDGLTDAKSWTGLNYPKSVLSKSTFIIN